MKKKYTETFVFLLKKEKEFKKKLSEENSFIHRVLSNSYKNINCMNTNKEK